MKFNDLTNRKPMKKILFLVFAVMAGSVLSVQASDKTQRFGKIVLANLESEICPIDSNAHAYYIFDNGTTDFYFMEHFKLRSVRHFRIKILDETALDMATIEVPLYTSAGSDKEAISSIKAVTYNLEDGKIVESKMDKDAIVQEVQSARNTIAKFTLPNVKAGSIIEVRYTVNSDFIFNLNTWFFQSSIPILDSYFLVDIPEYLNYKKFPHGYIHITTKESGSTSSFLINKEQVPYAVKRYEFAVNDVPAFPKSEYLTSISNYISSVEFELGSYIIPGFVHENYTLSWPQISKNLLTHANFGIRLKNSRCYKEEAASIASLDAEAKMAYSFDYIKKTLNWNKLNSCYTSQSLNATKKAKLGNCADINLSLVALMCEAGLDAYPVALSTRSNGFVNEYFPSVSSLNYIVAMCRIDGHNYLMDATNDYTSIGLLPTWCLNGKGLVITNDSEIWVSLQGDNDYSISHNYMLTLEADGMLKGAKLSKFSKYAAYLERNEIADFDNVDKFIEDYEDKHEGLFITDYTMRNVDSLYKNMSVKIDVEISDQVSVVNDLMYMKPMLYDGWYNNPLKLEERLYPVEYTYPLNMSYGTQITIPDGYAVESVPEALSIRSSDGTCTFRYIVNVFNGRVSVVSQFMRKQTLYPYTEYKNLKAFYEQLVKKHNEQIVFKKI